MYKFLVMLIFAVPVFGAHATQCPQGFYLTDGECVRCNQDSIYNKHYCPGDDTAHNCPVADISKATTCIERAQLSYSISSAYREEQCAGAAQCHENGGTYYYECRWNGENYSSCGAGNMYWRSADVGYYLAGYKSSSGTINNYNGVKPCTNKPAHSYYTGTGTPDDAVVGGRTDYNDCPWECDTGYGRHGNECAQLCTAGFNTLKTSSGVSVNVYSSRTSTPALNISTARGTCYVTLSAGSANDAINVQYNGNTYHTVD